MELKPNISNDYAKNRATFDPSDELVLNDGVLFDTRAGKEIKVSFYRVLSINSS